MKAKVGCQLSPRSKSSRARFVRFDANQGDKSVSDQSLPSLRSQEFEASPGLLQISEDGF